MALWKGDVWMNGVENGRGRNPSHERPGDGENGECNEWMNGKMFWMKYVGSVRLNV